MKKLVLILICCFSFFCLKAQTNTSNDSGEGIEEEINNVIYEGKDTMKIVSISPKKDLINGVVYEFSVEVNYNLVSKKKAILNIGFNNGSSEDSYRLISDVAKIINKGSGNHTFKIKAKVVDWSEIGGAFYLATNMSEYPHEKKWRPLASDRFFLKVE